MLTADVNQDVVLLHETISLLIHVSESETEVVLKLLKSVQFLTEIFHPFW